MLLWLVQSVIPMAPQIKKIITVVVVVAVCLWLLSVFVGFGSIGDIHVGRIR